MSKGVEENLFPSASATLSREMYCVPVRSRRMRQTQRPEGELGSISERPRTVWKECEELSRMYYTGSMVVEALNTSIQEAEAGRSA